jgi:hypothetical protein
VALAVGTILNLINQGDAQFGDRPPNLTKLLLTYLVPYFVATYGAVSYQLRQKRSPTVLRSGKDEAAMPDPPSPVGR